MVRTCLSLSSSTRDCAPVLQRCFQLVVSQLVVVVVIESRSATLQAVGVAMHCGEILGLSWDIISSVCTVCVCVQQESLLVSSDDVSGAGGGLRRAEERSRVDV